MLQTIGILDYKNENMGNPCGKYITDEEFLKHMIPHHQVAIDMSHKVSQTSLDPIIIYLARNIIYGQTDEILLMENMLLSGIPMMASNDKSTYIEIPNQFTIWYPKMSRADNSDCKMHHFQTMNDNNKLSDEQYLRHMIQHHDVAVEMAERMTKHSKNPMIVSFAYDIIKNQRYEIWLMKQLLESKKIHSPILENFVSNPNYSYILSHIVLIIAIIIIFRYYNEH